MAGGLTVAGRVNYMAGRMDCAWNSLMNLSGVWQSELLLEGWTGWNGGL